MDKLIEKNIWHSIAVRYIVQKFNCLKVPGNYKEEIIHQLVGSTGSIPMVRTREPQVAALLACERHVDVWSDPVGDVHLRRGALGGAQWGPDTAEDRPGRGAPGSARGLSFRHLPADAALLGI